MNPGPDVPEGEEYSGGLASWVDPLTGTRKFGTVSDLTILERFFDDNLYEVSVEFQRSATVADVARLRRVVPEIKSIPAIQAVTLIAGLNEWSAGIHYRHRANELAGALRDQGYVVKITQIKAGPGSSP